MSSRRLPTDGGGTAAPPSWSLPLIILALTVPIVAAFALGGAAAGLATGALVTGTLIFIAVRMAPYEPIEGPPDGAESGMGVLVVLDREPGEPELDQLAEVLRRAGGGEQRTPLRVVAPTRPGRVARWATDLAEAQADAQLRLVHVSAALARADLEVDARLGDADAVQAVTDELRSFPAARVVLVTDPSSDAAEELRLRLRLPMSVISSQPV